MEGDYTRSYLDDSSVYLSRTAENGDALEKIVRRFEESPEEITPTSLNELNNALSFIMSDAKKLKRTDPNERDPLFNRYSSLCSKIKTLYYVHKDKFDDAISGIDLLPTRCCLKRQLSFIGINIIQ